MNSGLWTSPSCSEFLKHWEIWKIDPEPAASNFFMNISGDGMRYSSLEPVNSLMNRVENALIVGSGIRYGESVGVDTSR